MKAVHAASSIVNQTAVATDRDAMRSRVAPVRRLQITSYDVGGSVVTILLTP
jgi:hypothetical protein